MLLKIYVFGYQNSIRSSRKRALSGGHFLLRGKAKVEGEFALAALAYDMRRAKGMLGFEGLMEAVAPGLLPSLRDFFCRISPVFQKVA